MQTPTTAPLRALAIATALVAGTGVAAAALVSPPDDIEAQTVRFETASDTIDETRSTLAEGPPTQAPTPPPAPSEAAAQVAVPGPAEDTATAAGSAPQSDAYGYIVDDAYGYIIDAVDQFSGRTPLPLSTSTLMQDLPPAAAEVLALLPDPEALTAAVTACIDELRTLVPDLPAEIDRDAGLRGLVQGMFDGTADRAPLALPDSAVIAESIEACMTLLQGVLPAPEDLEPLLGSLAEQASLPPELTALVDEMWLLFEQMQQPDGLAAMDPSAALDALRSLIPADGGTTDSPTIGILEALLDRIAPAG